MKRSRSLKTTKTLKRKLDQVFSQYIRLKYSKNGSAECATCGKIDHWKNMDCGHFMSRRYLNTRWNEKNAAPQCKACNRFNQGRQYEMSKWIDRTHGEGTADQMTIAKNTIWKPLPHQLQFMILEYKHKINLLEKIVYLNNAKD